MLRAGERIGDWVVVSQLGEGGMGAVFLCHNALSERMTAAIKVLKSHELGDARERFIREMEALAQLQHPAIVRVMGSGEDGNHGVLWMAMEVLDGETLEDRLDRGPIEWQEALGLFRSIAEGLTHAHELGIRHRDIKPANIMVTSDGSVKLLDFGIAVQAGRTRLTNDRTVPGTLPYIPPEIFEGTKPNAVLADVYASGLLLYEMIAGRRAYPEDPDLSAGQRMAQIMAAKLAGGPVDPGKSVARAVRQLITWATEPDPEDRMPEMRMFLVAVDSILDGEIDQLPEIERSDGVMLVAPGPGKSTGTTGKVRAPSTMNFDLDDEPEADFASEELYIPQSQSQLPVMGGAVAAIVVVGLAAVLFVGQTEPVKPAEPTVEEPLVPVADIPEKGPGSALLPFGYQMIPIKRGDFWMGSHVDEPGARQDELRHPVSISQPFLIGRTEVTQDLWAAVMDANPAADQTYGPEDAPVLCEKWGVGDKLPVMCVTWEEAAAFTNALSALEGLEPAYSLDEDGQAVWNREASGYRLPTEAEWEFAARGTNQAHVFSGTASVDEACKYSNLANPETKQRFYAWLTWKALDCEDGHLKLTEVAQLEPGANGLYDMNGNVMEWVWDYYADYEVPEGGQAIDPTGPETGEERVRRGGDWASGIKEGRIAARDHAPADDRLPRAGLRIVRNGE